MPQDNDFNIDEDRFKRLVANPTFQARILKLRKKYGIPKDGFKDNKSEYAKKDEYSEVELAEIKEALHDIASTFKLSDRWHQGLHYYLFGNNPFMFRVQSPYVVKFEHEDVIEWENDKAKTYRTVWIGVDADTTEDELKEALKVAKDYLPKREPYRPAFQISHAIMARQLKESSKMTWWQVAEEVNRQFPPFDYNDESIRKAVARLKKQS